MSKVEQPYGLKVKNRNRKLTLSIFVMVLSLLLLLLSEILEDILDVEKNNLIFASILIFIAAVGVYLYYYLDFSHEFYYNPKEDKKDIESLLENDFIERFNEKEDTNVKDIFISRIKNEIEFDYLLDELYSLEYKFKKQIERLVNNSNLNLIIGIITTSIAVITLGFSIFQNVHFDSNVDLVTYFIPRISTMIFVEIFSFFFLRLYKNNLNDIKYYQNEITNLGFKMASLKVAIKSEDSSALNEIIRNFSNTERNFILKKDETTEKLESLKTETNQSSNFTKSMKDLVDSIKK